MHHALIWLLVIELLGLIALPISFSLFRRLPDRGLALSKLLALLLGSYALWILGLTQVIPNTIFTIIAILAVLALVSAFVLRRMLPEIISFLRQEWRVLLTAELVFLGLYSFWLLVVSASPAINHTEKPMDFAFLNSILRSDYFPPEDPWLAGHSISYYYFGHLMMAFLTKLSSIPSNITYNLSIALVAALVGAAAFSLVYNLIRLSGARVRTAALFALVAPVFILLIGNLEGVLEFAHARGWGSEGFWQWISIKGLETAQGGDASVFPRQHLWWWHATRVIDTVVDGRSLDYTITEFPFFSFLLGDLHAHVLALPFIVLVLAFGLNLYVSVERFGLAWLRRYPWEVLAITLSLGSLAFINIWDFPVLALLLVVLVLVKSYGDWGGQLVDALVPSLMIIVPILVGAILLFLPFYLTLSSQASGIAAQGDESTRPLFFFLIWGPFLVLSGFFLLVQLWTTPGLKVNNPGPLSLVMVITLLPFLLWAGWQLLAVSTGWGILESIFEKAAVDDLASVASKFGKVLLGMAIVAVALYSFLLRLKQGADRAVAFPLLLMALAFYLLVGAELFYLLDLFGNRMNTVFKIYFQSWLFLALVSAFGLYYCSARPMPALMGPPRRLKGWGRRLLVASPSVLRYGWLSTVAVLFAASLYYPVGAALDRSNNTPGSRTLDGLAFLDERHPGEYQAIKWLRDEAPWGRIVEAIGDDYSEFGRISASTGLPTVLGWKGHEHQWRGSTNAFRGREDQVDQIYSSGDPQQVRDLLGTFDIRYVYMGARERGRYGNVRFDLFSAFLQPVYESQGVVIYERIQGSEQVATFDLT